MRTALVLLALAAFIATAFGGVGGPDIDSDGDGWTPNQGDCCEFPYECGNIDPTLVNPGAFEIPANTLDDNCNGVVDEAATVCEPAPGTGPSTNDFARAIGICDSVNPVTNAGFGFVSGEITRASRTGTPAAVQYSVIPSFGTAANSPRQGATMGAISSGTAVAPGTPGYSASYSAGAASQPPADYLAANGGVLATKAGCPTTPITNYDSVRVALTLRAPTNAQSFSFNFRFFSREYPSYVCTQYNDFFIVLLQSSNNLGIPADKQIAFDTNGNAVTINNAFFTTCATQLPQYNSYCPDGSADLAGTGMEQNGATSWLQTSAPIVKGETFTIEFFVWDTGDSALDSTALIDNFRWSLQVANVTTSVTTGTTGVAPTTAAPSTESTGSTGPYVDPVCGVDTPARRNEFENTGSRLKMASKSECGEYLDKFETNFELFSGLDGFVEGFFGWFSETTDLTTKLEFKVRYDAIIEFVESGDNAGYQEDEDTLIQTFRAGDNGENWGPWAGLGADPSNANNLISSASTSNGILSVIGHFYSSVLPLVSNSPELTSSKLDIGIDFRSLYQATGSQLAVVGLVKSFQKTRERDSESPEFQSLNLINDVEALPIAGLWTWVTYVNQIVNGVETQVPIIASPLIDVTAGEPEFKIFFTIDSVNHDATFLWDPTIGYEYTNSTVGTEESNSNPSQTSTTQTGASTTPSGSQTGSTTPVDTNIIETRDDSAASAATVSALLCVVLALFAM